MAESFKCPSCSAPLKFQGKMVQTCKFCGSDVIVPSDLVKPKEEDDFIETKPLPKDELLEDASELGQKALKVAEIKHAIHQNRKISAAILFRDNFGGSLADAKEIIESIESGESVYVPDFQTDEGRKSSSSKWIILLIVVIAIFLIFFLVFGRNLF